MKRLLPWIVAVWCLFFGAQAQAASFDCAKADAKVEKLVCADEKLSKLDEELQSVYQDAYKHTADPAGLKMEQRQWLKTREACKDVACVTDAYRTRLAALKATLAEPKPCFRLLERKWPEVASGHYPVCVDFLKNLNTFCGNPPICEWKVNPSIKTLALPQWEEINPKAHLKIIQNMLQRYYSDPESKWIPIPPDMMQRINEGTTRMWHAWVDPDRDGLNKHVVRFDDLPCDGKRNAYFFGLPTYMAVVDADITKVDSRYEYFNHIFGIVLHDGQTYAINGGPSYNDVPGSGAVGTGDSLNLQEPFSARGGLSKGMDSVCVFEYLK